MRTTVTLDADVESLLKRVMRDSDMTFKQAINEAIRRGLTTRHEGEQFLSPTYDLGEPLVDLTKALRVSSQLEDLELTARLNRGA